MKFWLTGLLILSITCISLLGFLALGYNSHHEKGCLASTSEQMPCPVQSNNFAFADFHIRALTKIFQITLVLIALLLGMTFCFFLLSENPPSPAVVFSLKRQKPIQPNLRLKRWLALLEKRDPARIF